MRERLGRYHLIRSIASGGMGEIFLAEHTGISGFAKRVALKRIKPALADDPAYVQLFLNEARIGSFLNHPNIVHIFDVGHDDGELWLVMEYVDGVDLKRLARRAQQAGQPLPPVVVAAVMVEVLSALEEAHEGGPTHGEPIIHRDMSPENILIARSGAVKVLDFGLAKWSPGQRAVPSMEGSMIFGKVRYMPPEQLRGHLIDVRADLFSLGVVMYETLRGVLPFGSGNANQVLAEILGGPPPSPTEARYPIDSALDRIILRAIDKDPARRFQTAHELRDALVQYVEGHARPLPLEGLRRLLYPGATLADEDVPSIPASPASPPRSRRGAAVGRDTSPSSPRGRRASAGEHPPAPSLGLPRLGLEVKERCGKCGGPFEALFLDGAIVDRCRSCQGVWLDAGEVERMVGAATESETVAPGGAAERAPLDHLIGSCPTCRIGLSGFPVPGEPASLELCPRCHGLWLDAGELRLLGEGSVVAWLRGVLDPGVTSRGGR